MKKNIVTFKCSHCNKRIKLDVNARGNKEYLEHWSIFDCSCKVTEIYSLLKCPICGKKQREVKC